MSKNVDIFVFFIDRTKKFYLGLFSLGKVCLIKCVSVRSNLCRLQDSAFATKKIFHLPEVPSVCRPGGGCQEKGGVARVRMGKVDGHNQF